MPGLGSRVRRFGVFAATLMAAGVVVLVAGCTTYNPATGGQAFTPFMSPAQEQQLGASSHDKMVKENGGAYDNPKLAAYVTGVGNKLVANSEDKDQHFTFTVLNEPLVNAFAMPGGYVYITRGILAYINSEAELASVLGHEIGHVTARHTAQRYSQQVMTGVLGTVLGAVVGSRAVGDAVNYGGKLYLLSYSRDQEYQADSLGERYMTRAGYDPYAAADMLHMLGAQQKLATLVAHGEGRKPPSEFFSTHPNSAHRVARTEALAEQTGLKPHQRPRLRSNYLDAINGMLFGEDPTQGLVRGRVFWHPVLRLTFTVPPGYTIDNTAHLLAIHGPAGVEIVFGGGRVKKTTTTTAYMGKIWDKIDSRDMLQDIQAISIHGLEARTGWTEADTAKHGRVNARIVAIRYSPTRVYYFFIMAPADQMASLATGLQRMTYSFRKLTAAEAQKVKPYRIRAVTVGKQDTIQTMAARMATPDYPLQRFLVLNGLAQKAHLDPGSRVKIIVAD